MEEGFKMNKPEINTEGYLDFYSVIEGKGRNIGIREVNEWLTHWCKERLPVIISQQILTSRGYTYFAMTEKQVKKLKEEITQELCGEGK